MLFCCSEKNSKKDGKIENEGAISETDSDSFPGEDLQLSQSTCLQGSDPGEPSSVFLSTNAQGITVDIKNMAFSCGIAIKASLLIQGKQANVTIHPANMNPKTLVKCACPYNFSMVIPSDKGQMEAVQVFKQDSNYGGPSKPVSAGEQKVGELR